MSKVKTLWDKYTENTASGKELESLYQSLESTEISEILEQAWDASKPSAGAELQEADKALLNKIKHGLEFKKEAKVVRMQRRAFAVAASIAAIVVFLTFNPFGKTEINEEQPVVHSVGIGKKPLKIELPDESLVWLNVATTLSYEEDFDIRRNVVLDGEAYFEIQENYELPFTVQFKNLELRVTGTSFNVKAYPNEERSVVSVKAGNVEIFDLVEQEILGNNDRVIIDHESGIKLKEDNKFRNSNAWVEGKLVFRDTPLEDVLKSMERYYDIEIITSSNTAILEKPLTATYPANINIQEVMDGLAFLQGIKYEFVEDGVIQLI